MLGIEHMLTNIVTNIINNLSPELKAGIQKQVGDAMQLFTAMRETAERVEQRLSVIEGSLLVMEIKVSAIEQKFRGDFAGDTGDMTADPELRDTLPIVGLIGYQDMSDVR